jgi:hypothetical protein
VTVRLNAFMIPTKIRFIHPRMPPRATTDATESDCGIFKLIAHGTPFLLTSTDRWWGAGLSRSS